MIQRDKSRCNLIRVSNRDLPEDIDVSDKKEQPCEDQGSNCLVGGTEGSKFLKLEGAEGVQKRQM